MEKLTKKDIISNIAEDSHLTKKDITEVVDLALRKNCRSCRIWKI